MTLLFLIFNSSWAEKSPLKISRSTIGKHYRLTAKQVKNLVGNLQVVKQVKIFSMQPKISHNSGQASMQSGV